MTEVGPNDVLHQYSVPGRFIIISAESQENVSFALDAVELLAVGERKALGTTTRPTWHPVEDVRDDLRLLRERVDTTERRAVDRAIDMVEYDCSIETGLGVAVVPPPASNEPPSTP